jgi:flavin reductase (DIM6/NTAB) family NADH-FMN oxidoreductase RutF
MTSIEDLEIRDNAIKSIISRPLDRLLGLKNFNMLMEIVRTFMRQLPLGVAIVTTWNDGPFGMTVNTFNSLSLNPPLVMFSADRTRGNHRPFLDSSHFAVNLVEDIELLDKFAVSPLAERFKGVTYIKGQGGSPILQSAFAYLEAKVRDELIQGDHSIIVGEVMDGKVLRDGEPPVYYKRTYWRLRRA